MICEQELMHYLLLEAVHSWVAALQLASAFWTINRGKSKEYRIMTALTCTKVAIRTTTKYFASSAPCRGTALRICLRRLMAPCELHT